jgi:hypothetical protein
MHTQLLAVPHGQHARQCHPGPDAAAPEKFQTITSDNGTEFHGYAQIEAASPVKFYFATPHHSWERGTDENTSLRIALRTARMAPSVQKCWLTPDSLLDR